MHVYVDGISGLDLNISHHHHHHGGTCEGDCAYNNLMWDFVLSTPEIVTSDIFVLNASIMSRLQKALQDLIRSAAPLAPARC